MFIISSNDKYSKYHIKYMRFNAIIMLMTKVLRSPKANQAGYTLLELLIVIIAILILVGVAVFLKPS